jgi:hypothetical protein
MEHNKGITLIGILIVIIAAGIISSSFYYYISKQIPKIPENTQESTEGNSSSSEEALIEEQKAEDGLASLPEEILPSDQEITCQDECPQNGLKKCSANGYQTCGNYNADTCLEWSSIASCIANTVCQNGNCVQQECSDGTLSGQCSKDKTKFCDFGNLVNKCSICGCPEGTTCKEDGECKINRITCLKSGVCVNDDIFLIIQKSNDPFIGYGVMHVPTQPGEILMNKEITKFYSKSVAKEADFLVVFKDFDSAPSWAYFVGIKRDTSTRGIGMSWGDHSDFYGTKGDLLALIVAPNIMDLKTSELYDENFVTVAHEIGHYWLMSLDNPMLRIGEGMHYSSCFQNGNIDYRDLMGSTIWNQIADNKFTSINPADVHKDQNRFSPLSLYLMGLIGKEEVGSMYLIEPQDGSSNCMVFNFYNEDPFKLSVIGTKRSITINDIISTYGDRIPSNLTAKKEFSIQFALVTHENSTLTQEDVDKFEKFIGEFPSYFSYATFNKAVFHIVPVK